MEQENFRNILAIYIPEQAVKGVLKLFEEYPCNLKITRERVTKQGDFRILKNRQPQITVNHNLNKYSFLLTLVHELAHLATHTKYKKAKPHGIEWKEEFKYMMLPFINNFVFPNDLLPYLAQYFINPKAATGSDVQLAIALKKYDVPSNKIAVYELAKGSEFTLNRKKFILGEKRRTRYKCIEKESQKTYLIHQNAEVTIT